MTDSESNMQACQLNNLSPTDTDVMWVYANHGYMCSTAVVKGRVLVSFANKVDESFAFWSLQDIPYIKRFKLPSDCEKELASVAVALQLLGKKFSNSYVLMLVNNWEVNRLLNDEIKPYDGTVKKTLVNFIKRYTTRKGIQIRFKSVSKNNDVVSSLKECDIGKFKELTSTMNATKVMPREDCFSFL